MALVVKFGLTVFELLVLVWQMARASLLPDRFKGKGTPLSIGDLLVGQLELSAINIVSAD